MKHLGIALALALAAASPLAAQTADPLKVAPVPSLPIADGFTFAAVGDIIYLRTMLATVEKKSPDMLKLLRGADVTFGNFETMALDLATTKASPQAESGGTWMLAAPGVPKEVAAMGFDIVSVANNHATDWGAEGLFETMERLDDAGLIHAGVGRTLSLARAPRYFDAGAGRVGMVSASSSFTPMSRAGDPVGEVAGRPGLNPVRVERIALVPQKHYDTLVEIAATAPTPTTPKDGVVRLLGTSYKAAERPDGKIGFSYKPNANDVAANLLAVRQAKQNGNFALFTLHNHEPSNSSETPADFAITLARQAIDAGADAYVGHGPHILRGIEIYKGKPIFYSLANFAMMNNSLDAVPADMYDQYGVAPGSATIPELLAARNARVFSDPALYESVIAISRYEGGRVAEIKLYPIDLGVNLQGAARGVPMMADAVVGKRILERLQRLSAPFGTKISIEKGVGIIRVPAGGDQ